MSYSYRDMMNTYEYKFSTYSLYQVDRAIRDIDATLSLYRDRPTSDPYVAKLFCERDAALDRKFALKSRIAK